MGLIDAVLDVLAGLIAPQWGRARVGDLRSLWQSGARADDWSRMHGSAATSHDERTLIGRSVPPARGEMTAYAACVSGLRLGWPPTMGHAGRHLARGRAGID